MSAAPVIDIRGVSTRFGRQVVHEGLDLAIGAGELVAIIGGSGTGKSVLLKEIIGLIRPRSGSIRLFGEEVWKAGEPELMALRRRFGVLFQDGALFSSLTLMENVQVPMREYLDLPRRLMDELALLKIELVGLSPDDAGKFPSELSGGMVKRAALARALSLDPDIVFLDEPTSGLDPISAAEFDELVVKLRDTMGLTVYMVTHDLDSLFTACDRGAVLGRKKVLVEGTIEDMLKSEEPWVKSYFRGKRARQLDLAGRQ